MTKVLNFALIIIFLTSFIGCKNSNQSSSSELNWLTVEEASKIAEGNNEKKFIIDVYTDWCGWCKVMDKKTFTDPELIKYLNEHFYVVKFNAEQKEEISYKGKIYKWESMGRNGVNMLGYELLQGRMSYPSLVYLNSNLETIFVSPGYKEPAQLMSELKSL
jgi:thioredoxin-related protein